MIYSNIEELLELTYQGEKKISEIVIEAEMKESERTREAVMENMLSRFIVMKNAIKSGLKGEAKSITGLTGGDAAKIYNNKHNLFNGLYKNIIAAAIATSEVNASMGKIVGGPTAGSSGIIPGVVWGLGEMYNIEETELLLGLFTAGGLGDIVSKKMNLSGAAGGCQAECGVASAMAAGAAVELLGGTPEMVCNGFALALKNLLGLTCDPVAGLVEVPCVKRNGFASSHAITAAFMALSGVESVIPPDQVIDVLYKTGKLIPISLKETSQAGLACTPAALEISRKIDMEGNKE